MATPLDVPAFLDRSRALPVFDVRTPAEFDQGHLPGAYNLPLFSNDERADVGTLYKHEGRQAAILRGLEFVGPKMRDLVDTVQTTVPDTRSVLVHCWRGGMRSESVAWLLETCGYKAYTLRGGYKAFRRHVLDLLMHPRLVYLLGGMTGAGKTDVLHALARRGEQVIDLEGLAHHKGSVFGGLGEAPQPTQQQFENELALQWADLHPDRPVWVEDESRRIGQLSVPTSLWQQMQRAPIYVLDVPASDRVDRLVTLYGDQSTDDLAHAFDRIETRLGGKRTQEALEALARGDLHTACALSLHYYDRAYQHALQQRPTRQVYRIAHPGTMTPDTLAETLLATST